MSSHDTPRTRMPSPAATANDTDPGSAPTTVDETYAPAEHRAEPEDTVVDDGEDAPTLGPHAEVERTALEEEQAVARQLDRLGGRAPQLAVHQAESAGRPAASYAAVAEAAKSRAPSGTDPFGIIVAPDSFAARDASRIAAGTARVTQPIVPVAAPMAAAVREPVAVAVGVGVAVAVGVGVAVAVGEPVAQPLAVAVPVAAPIAPVAAAVARPARQGVPSTSPRERAAQLTTAPGRRTKSRRRAVAGGLVLAAVAAAVTGLFLQLRNPSPPAPSSPADGLPSVLAATATATPALRASVRAPSTAMTTTSAVPSTQASEPAPTPSAARPTPGTGNLTRLPLPRPPASATGAARDVPQAPATTPTTRTDLFPSQ